MMEMQKTFFKAIMGPDPLTDTSTQPAQKNK